MIEGFKQIAIISDFGTRDYFVAAMKGVISGIAPDARIIDLSHHIPAQDITRGAQFLKSIVDFYPEGTLFLAIVDPTVGSQREGIAFFADGKGFVGPNNGIFSLCYQNNPGASIIQKREIAPFTFHGRDMFAPFAAKWFNAGPYNLSKLTEKRLDDTNYVRCFMPEPIQEPGMIHGQIVWIDHFGNCITNISLEMLQNFSTSVRILFRDLVLDEYHWHYSEVESGEALALISSNNTLELSIRDGDFADMFEPAVEQFEEINVIHRRKTEDER